MSETEKIKELEKRVARLELVFLQIRTLTNALYEFNNLNNEGVCKVLAVMNQLTDLNFKDKLTSSKQTVSEGA